MEVNTTRSWGSRVQFTSQRLAYVCLPRGRPRIQVNKLGRCSTTAGTSGAVHARSNRVRPFLLIRVPCPRTVQNSPRGTLPWLTVPDTLRPLRPSPRCNRYIERLFLGPTCQRRLNY